MADDALDLLAKAYMRGFADPDAEVTATVINGANADISWIQRDVEIFGYGRGDNSGTLTVPLATLVSQSASALLVEQVQA